ncbi:MAG: class I SAM-dependent methyltransferase [Opitutales bacterium]|nr:class I SAM-dependent methyltransferase [Opitutales bacterium]
MDLLPITEIPAFSATQAAHKALSAVLAAGDWVVDATAGNGHDTAFLADAVQPGGRVFACDRQRVALDATHARLVEAKLTDNVEFFQSDHADLSKNLPAEAHGRIRAVIFNLGYLPGGAKAIITEKASTLRALDTLATFLAPGGRLVVVAYRGHPGGEEEFAAVQSWFHQNREKIRILQIATAKATHRVPPVLFVGEAHAGARN